jgi:hypothetical protein
MFWLLLAEVCFGVISLTCIGCALYAVNRPRIVTTASDNGYPPTVTIRESIFTRTRHPKQVFYRAPVDWGSSE